MGFIGPAFHPVNITDVGLVLFMSVAIPGHESAGK